MNIGAMKVRDEGKKKWFCFCPVFFWHFIFCVPSPVFPNWQQCSGQPTFPCCGSTRRRLHRPMHGWAPCLTCAVHEPQFSLSDSALARCTRTWKAAFSRRAGAEVQVRLQGMTLAAAGVRWGELLISRAHGGVLHCRWTKQAEHA